MAYNETKKNTITVSSEGGDFTSLASAITAVASHTPSSSNRWTILVYPGVYTEAPMTLVPYVDIKPVSERFTTKIIASNTSTALFTTSGAGPMSVQDLSIDGVTTNAAFYNNTASTALQVANCQIANCQYGIHCNAGTVTSERIGAVSGSVMTNMFYSSGGTIMIDTATVLGSATFASFIKNDGGSVFATTVILAGSNVTTGFETLGGGESGVWTFKMTAGTTAIKVDGASTFDGGVLEIDGGLTTHVEIVDTSSTCHIQSGQMDSDKFLFPVGYSNDIINFIDHKEGDQGVRIFGELGVGRPERGTETVLGEGDSYTRGMKVYTYNVTGGVYTDVSDDAASASGSTFTFPGVAAENAIYVSSDLQNSDYLMHYGIKASINTATVLGAGEIVAEYWNGAWVEFNTSSIQSGGKYYPYANQIFERTGSEQVRNDYTILDDWAKNDPPTTGTTRFWVRYRIKTGITTAPIFEQFKLHTNRFEVNGDGFTEYFGASRPIGTLPWKISDATAWSSSPGNQDLFVLNSSVSTDYDIGFGRTENDFAANAMDRVSVGIPIPYDMDTSCPVTVEVYWTGNSSTAGNIAWKASAGTLRVGDGIGEVIGDAPSTIRDEWNHSDIETVGANEDDELKATKITLYLPSAISRDDVTGFGDFIALSIVSDGSDGMDTYPGSRSILNVRATYTKWCEGGHI